MMKSGAERYGAVTIILHWFVAAVVLALLILGFCAANATDWTRQASILRAHAPLGLGALVLVILRIIWRVFCDAAPKDIEGMTRAQIIAAKAVQGLLNLAILGLVVSGVTLMRASGAGNVLFDGAPGPLPNFEDFKPFFVHAALACVLIILVIGHIGAALYHQFIRRDNILARMGIGR